MASVDACVSRVSVPGFLPWRSSTTTLQSRLCSAIFHGSSRRLEAREVEGVVIRHAVGVPKDSVILVGPPAQPLEMLGTHPDVSVCKDKPSVVIQERMTGS